MKLDPADQIFSQYVRKSQGQCQRCGSPVRFNDKGLPISHHASHYFGRTRETTRFDTQNVDCLCHGCHRYWETEDREGYRNFKIKQLGQKEFDLLTIRANTVGHKDRKMALLVARQLLKSLEKTPRKES